MSVSYASRRLQSGSGLGAAALVMLLAFTLSISAAVHNHGLFATDGGAENFSQSKFTCPGCVFNGKPITVAEATIVVCDFGTLIFVPQSETSFEQVLEESSRTRAPPSA